MFSRVPLLKAGLTPDEQWGIDWRDAEDDLKIAQAQSQHLIVVNPHFIDSMDGTLYRLIVPIDKANLPHFVLAQNKAREYFSFELVEEEKIGRKYKKMSNIPLSLYLLRNPNLSLDQHYDLAIRICMALHDLHTKKKLAHRDITPETICILSKDKVELFDTNQTVNNPERMATESDSVSQASYEPQNITQFTLAQKDIFAVMRVLRLDAWYTDKNGTIQQRLNSSVLLHCPHLRTIELLSIYTDTAEGKVISVGPGSCREPKASARSKPKDLPTSMLDLAANLALLKMKKHAEYDAGVLPMLKTDEKEKIVAAGLKYSKEIQKEGKDETTVLIENQIKIERALAWKAINALKAKNISIDKKICNIISRSSNWRKELVKLLTNLGIEAARNSGTRNKNKLNYTDVTSGENHELEQAVRVMSHRMNVIRAWSNPTGSTAYKAAEKYFEAAREIANISDERWHEVLKARSITGQIKTYAQKFPFFSCMKSTEDTIKINEYRAIPPA